MASLHSSPWTPYKIHVGHSPRNDSAPAVHILRFMYEVFVSNFSKGSATESVGVSERRALFRKMFVSLSFGLLCVSVLRSSICRWRMTCIIFLCPFPFQPWLLWYARAQTHTASAQCCFYWCCPSCTYKTTNIPSIAKI